MDNQFSYKVIEPNDDYKEARIEKSGITAVFTLKDVEDHQAKLATYKKERMAEMEVERAKMANYAHYHPIVLELTGEQLTAAALYKESQTMVKKTEEKLAEIDEALKEYAEETEAIMLATGFVKAPALGDE
jgi:hypothetical protein